MVFRKIKSKLSTWYHKTTPDKESNLSNVNTNYFNEYSKHLELRILNRVEKDLKNGWKSKAINRLEGFLKHQSYNQEIRNKLGTLYIQANDQIRAGRHLFFKKNPTLEEKECINKFQKSFGHNPCSILKKLIHKDKYQVKKLDHYSKTKLKSLIEETFTELGTVPHFLKGVKRYLDKFEDSN